MIVLVGENAHARDEALAKQIAEYDGVVERIDGGELNYAAFVDAVAGTSLFTNKRMVVVRGLADNAELWTSLPDLLSRISGDVQLVLVEDKLDKRTASYKALKKVADIHEFTEWREYDDVKAQQWLHDEAKRRSVSLSQQQIRDIVGRTGPVQWRLADALDKLALHDEITDETIINIVPQQPLASAFSLLRTGLTASAAEVHQQLRELEATNDPYQLMGLLASQAVQLVALTVAGTDNDVAKDLGASPYVLRELRPLALKLSRHEASNVLDVLQRADNNMKQGGVDPWQALEVALAEIAAK